MDLNDNDLMPWGKHQGQRLRDVPRDYWAWLLLQPWFPEHRDLHKYADLATAPKLTFAETVRLLRRS